MSLITKGFTSNTIITLGLGLGAFIKQEYVKLKSVVHKIIKLRSRICT